jgi:small-conductance mechanosensitive channel
VGKTEELAKFDRAMKDCEVRLRTFEANINTLKKEIDFLISLEKQLSENIAYLKKIKVIALAKEYKDAREDLKKTKTRILQLKSDLTINEKAYKDVESFLEKNRVSYDKLTKQSDNNVVQGKFGRKRV